MKIIAFLLLFCVSVYSQVGIGTTTPKGALDITHSTNGFLMPRVVLTATNVSAPVVNPAGGALEVGTMVFNTNTTAGTFGVIPGLYYWDGAKWVYQFHRNYKTNFSQSSDLTLATSSGAYTNIPGLNNKSFVAPYDGEYQIIFTGYLGAPTVSDNTTNLPSSRDISGYSATAFVEGIFRLTVNSINYDKYSYSISLYRSGSGTNGTGGTDLFELFNEVNIIITVNLTAGSTCNLNAAYTGASDDNASTALPHIVGSTTSGLGNKCEVNISYIGR